MSVDTIARMLDEMLPDATVEEELRGFLRQWRQADGFVPIEVDSQNMLVPVEATVEVVAKAFIKEVYSIAFSTGYRAQVALGGVVANEGHGLSARYCFVTMFFNGDLKKISMDFHSRAVWI